MESRIESGNRSVYELLLTPVQCSRKVSCIHMVEDDEGSGEPDEIPRKGHSGIEVRGTASGLFCGSAAYCSGSVTVSFPIGVRKGRIRKGRRMFHPVYQGLPIAALHEGGGVNVRGLEASDRNRPAGGAGADAACEARPGADQRYPERRAGQKKQSLLRGSDGADGRGDEEGLPGAAGEGPEASSRVR